MIAVENERGSNPRLDIGREYIGNNARAKLVESITESSRVSNEESKTQTRCLCKFLETVSPFLELEPRREFDFNYVVVCSFQHGSN
jgi:hypothetical protein